MADTNTSTKFDLSFKYGEFKNLPTTISNGTIYVTTDDKTMYVDLDGQRIRLGDISLYQNIDDLSADQKNWYKGALAYVSSTNHLTYFNGTSWVVINDPDVQTKINEAIAAEVINRNAAIKVEKERAEAAEGALSDKIDDVEEVLEGITGTTGSLKTLEDNLKKYTDDAAKALISGTSDTKDSNTIAGAKLYADDVAEDAIATADGYTDGQITGLSISYDKTNKKVILKNKAGTQVSEFDATDFIKDGMLDTATYNASTNKITLTWNTDSGKTAMDIDLNDLVDTYTGGTGISVATNGAISIDDTVVVTHTDLNTTTAALIGTASDTKDSSTITGAKKYADNVQTTLVGTTSDTKASNTITGAKKYADDAVSTAKTTLIGTSSDTKASNTITGAKKYADDVANTAKESAITAAEAKAGELDNAVKTALIGTSTDTKDSNTITGAKKYADNAATTAANNAKTALIGTSSDTKTSNTITGAKKYADATQAAAQSYADDVADTAEDNANAYTNARLTWGTF